MSGNVIHEIMDSLYIPEKYEFDKVALIRMNPRFFHELALLDKFQSHLSTDFTNGYNKFDGIPVEITPKVERYIFLTDSEVGRRPEKKIISYKISIMDRLESADGDVEYKFAYKYEGYKDEWNGVFIQLVAEQILSCANHDEVRIELECNGFIHSTLFTGVRLRSQKDIRAINFAIENCLLKIKDVH